MASKLDYAKYLATAPSHVIAQGQDQVGLAVLRAGLDEFLPPAGTPRHVAVVQETIEQLATRPATEMASSCGSCSSGPVAAA